MIRYAVLLKFTDKGLLEIKKSPRRADAFRTQVKKAGGEVEAQLWTLGSYDGVIVFTAPEETTAAGLVLSLGASDCVSTYMLRAFDAGEFKKVLAKMA